MKFPPAALQQHIAVLGKTGSGKTFAAKGLVEGLLAGGACVGVVDPTSAWWGLRHASDGKGPGFSVLVLGGDHGDIGLAPSSGAAVARLLAEQRVSLVADTGLMTVGERTRWFIDFATTVYRLNRAPLHLVLDEAHNFAPQGKVQDPDAGRMLHAANTLASGGRSRGIRLTMITQRPQKLHKDALTSADTLIAMRVLAPHDRDAVRDWIDGCGDRAQGKAVLDSLASLQRGEGWIWYPEGSHLERVRFPAIRTFDSSATPTGTSAVATPKHGAAIDLTEIKAALADAVKEAEANDPKVLRARIAELERAAAKAAPATDPEALQAEFAKGMKAAVDVYDRKVRPLAVDALRYARQAVTDAEAVIIMLDEITSGNPHVVTPAPTRDAQPERPRAAPRPLPPTVSNGAAPARSTRAAGAPDTSIPKGERITLIALAQYPRGCTREQLSILTGYKRSSRDAYLQRLREKGFAQISGDVVLATDSGIAALGSDYEPLPTGGALRDYWLNRLPTGEAAILRMVIDCHPTPAPRDWLSKESGYQRSSRDAYIQRLGARRLVRPVGRGEIAASDELFD